MYVLYTTRDDKDVTVIPEFQYTALLENLKYTHAVSRASRHSNLFLQRNLTNQVVAGMAFDDLPDSVKALIVLYEL